MQAKSRALVKNYAPCCVAVLTGLALPHLVCTLLWGAAVLDMAASLGLSPLEYISQFCVALQH